jgi:hypothetical protein
VLRTYVALFQFDYSIVQDIVSCRDLLPFVLLASLCGEREFAQFNSYLPSVTKRMGKQKLWHQTLVTILCERKSWRAGCSKTRVLSHESTSYLKLQLERHIPLGCSLDLGDRGEFLLSG